MSRRARKRLNNRSRMTLATSRATSVTDQNSAGDRQDRAGDQNGPPAIGAEQQAGDDYQFGRIVRLRFATRQTGWRKTVRGASSPPNNKRAGSPVSNSRAATKAAHSKVDPARAARSKTSKAAINPVATHPSAGQSGQQQDSDSVASDGTNDGDAIERILKHRDKQDPNTKAQAGEKSSANDQQNSTKPAGDQQDAKKRDGAQQGEQSGDPTGQSPLAASSKVNNRAAPAREPGKQVGSNRSCAHNRRTAVLPTANNRAISSKRTSQERRRVNFWQQG